MTMQAHQTDALIVASPALVSTGLILKWLAGAEPWLASLSYIVAIVASIIAVYYKIKNKE